MKEFSVTYTRLSDCVREGTTTAEDARAALENAPKVDGFVVDSVEEILPEDSDREPEHLEVYSSCEGCGVAICMDDDYVTCADDAHLCRACYDACDKSDIVQDEDPA